MTPPRATYRLQFREGFDFAAAADIAGYLARLGISHVYASPVFAARSGSSHGYDVTDFNELDAELGGRPGFERMVEALKRHGLGLILDFVPNHMAASVENPWWHDVLAHGPQGAHAEAFDIDWDRSDGRLLLPVLGDAYGAVLERGEITIAEEDARTWVQYYDHRFPTSPDSPDNAPLHDFLEAQHYRLAHWRLAPDAINYRRFFDVNDLAGPLAVLVVADEDRRAVLPGERAHAVALVVGGSHFVAPVADELLDIPLGLRAAREASGDECIFGGVAFAQSPFSFNIRSRRVKTLRALPSKMACFSSSEISSASI